MADPTPAKPPTVYITVDLSPSAEASTKSASPAARPPARPRTPVVWEPPDAADLGKVLPGYEVHALIGSGGMGAVYRAKQKSLERLVAVKVLSPELAERAPEFTERFNTEASALAKLSHPSIVHLFDCGRTHDDHLYIAMELVEGKDVAERLGGKHPLSPTEVLAIALTVCEALAHAHQRGVIHRDIKPANVMIDGAGRVKITDFGLARIIHSSVPKERKTTFLLGTPRFTAPEAMIPGAEVDARADIFSVGVMLYQMLTGEVPRGAAAPPSNYIPGLDKGWDSLVAKAMAEDARDRYPSAQKLWEALDELRRVPSPEGLPAATIIDIKKKKAAEPSQEPAPGAALKVERTVPPPKAPMASSGERPAAPVSLMPWWVMVLILGVAGFWGWQQWHHPDEGMLGGPTSVNEIRTAPKEEVPGSGVAPPSPSSTGALLPVPSTALPLPPVENPSLPMSVQHAGPSPQELTEAQRRIGQIRGDFDTGLKEWQAAQDAKLNQLLSQYLRAVRNGIVTTRNARLLNDLAGLEEEEKMLLAKRDLPALDASLQPERARLRSIYDGQVREINKAGVEAKIEIYNRLIGSLFAYQSILKQTNKTAAADQVAQIMDQSVKERDALRQMIGAQKP